jgi:hypothetical protein
VRPPWGDGDLLAGLDVPDVRQRERVLEARADRRVGEDVEAETRVSLDPLGVQQRASGDTDRRVDPVPEEMAAFTRGQPPDARQDGRVTVVPSIGAVDLVDGL